MIAYDVTDPDSMLAIPNFISKLYSYWPGKIPIVIMANKIDLDPDENWRK